MQHLTSLPLQNYRQMNYINPHEISGKILTLIEEAENELIIVSPYIKIRSWTRMVRALQKAVRNEVKITFVLRKNAEQKKLFYIEELGIKVILIDDLHAKLYINDSSAIVTSHNLYYYSHINSLEIGHYTDNKKEIQELKGFENMYLLDKPKNPLKFAEKLQFVRSTNNIIIIQEDVEKLKEAFQSTYPRHNIGLRSGYIFSNDVVKHCDLMISQTFTLKFRRTNFDDSLVEKVEKFKFSKLDNDYIAQKDTKHPRYIYNRQFPF